MYYEKNTQRSSSLSTAPTMLLLRAKAAAPAAASRFLQTRHLNIFSVSTSFLKPHSLCSPLEEIVSKLSDTEHSCWKRWFVCVQEREGEKERGREREKERKRAADKSLSGQRFF